MNGPNFMQGWVAFAGSAATIALILTALELTLGFVKPADALRRIGVIASIVILLMLIPGVLVGAWLILSLWQRIALVAIGIGVWRLRRPHRQRQKNS